MEKPRQIGGYRETTNVMPARPPWSSNDFVVLGRTLSVARIDQETSRVYIDMEFLESNRPNLLFNIVQPSTLSLEQVFPTAMGCLIF